MALTGGGPARVGRVPDARGNGLSAVESDGEDVGRFGSVARDAEEGQQPARADRREALVVTDEVAAGDWGVGEVERGEHLWCAPRRAAVGGVAQVDVGGDPGGAVVAVCVVVQDGELTV